MKANAMGFYPIVGEGVISFPENSKIESFNEFLRAIRAVNNDYKAIIVVLYNFSMHVSNRVKKRASSSGCILFTSHHTRPTSTRSSLDGRA